MSARRKGTARMRWSASLACKTQETWGPSKSPGPLNHLLLFSAHLSQEENHSVSRDPRWRESHYSVMPSVTPAWSAHEARGMPELGVRLALAVTQWDALDALWRHE